MNTFWLKIAAIVVVIVTVVVLIGVFSSSEEPRPVVESANEPEAKPKTFYGQVEKDREKFSAKPQDVKEQVQEQNQLAGNQTPPEPVQLYFGPLSEIDKAEAERLLNVAVSGRSLGRLPQTGYQLMVQTCRQIIGKWPDSWYAYNAKKMLIDMPERFREQYKITNEELDISEFEKQRPGTEPFKGTAEAEEE
jgi:hypothetical protein